ncbi:hypothetical protein [Calidifontibacillus oryziterrae]|uniref:hypothetical protein n=1 Tax=Calidifontibacillus oryziterrae TaxID=1191699 RepID=UPI0002F6305A|nr:hypothetical protein [Calidifontibacillus oryziterrae]
MDELMRLQLLTEAVLEFKTQIKNDFEVDKMGEMVLEIVEQANDPQLLEFVEHAYDQRHNRNVAIDILNEALSYMHTKIDQLQI